MKKSLMFCFRNPVCYHCVTQLLPLQANVWLLAEDMTSDEFTSYEVRGAMHKLRLNNVVIRRRDPNTTSTRYQYRINPGVEYSIRSYISKKGRSEHAK